MSGQSWLWRLYLKAGNVRWSYRLRVKIQRKGWADSIRDTDGGEG